jgi:LuxR family maltose regulon positive regulatory protein
MPGRTATYVSRSRLLAPLLASRVAVVEASAGSGKSVLASQLREALGVATAYVQLNRADAEPVMLVSSLRRALRAARLSDLVAAIGAGPAAVDPGAAVERLLDALGEIDAELLLVLDDAHHLGDDAATLLIRLAGGLPTPHRLLICTRRLEGRLQAAAQLDGACALRHRDLAFSDEEAAVLLAQRGGEHATPEEMTRLVEATGGWATALVFAAVTGVGPMMGGGGVVGGRDLIAAPLRRILEPMSQSQRRALVWLAHLPLITPDLCDALVGESSALTGLIDAGVPLARDDFGWWQLPAPVADLLAARGRLASWAARVAADTYAAEGELVAAIRVLLAADLASEAAGLLEQSGPQAADELGFAAL